MLELYTLIAAVFAIDALLIGALVWAYHSPRFASRRLGPGPAISVKWKNRLTTMVVTSVLSILVVVGVTYAGFQASVLHVREVSPWTIVWQTAAILVVYDFIYYGLHRLMHHPKLLRHVHGVHHRARNPSALESFYQHPIELLSGLSLMFFATWLIGPVHVYTFAATFFVYSTFNIIVHAGFQARFWIFKPFDFLIRKHHMHHASDPGKNYSSLTPLPDLLFGTSG